jgi:hypothetical protein
VDDLRIQDLWFDSVFDFHAQRLKHSRAGMLYFRLRFGMKLKNTKMPFDHHQTRPNVCRLHGRVGHLIDEHPRSNLDQGRGHARHWNIASGIGSYIGSVLRLQSINVYKRSKLRHPDLLQEKLVYNRLGALVPKIRSGLWVLLLDTSVVAPTQRLAR